MTVQYAVEITGPASRPFTSPCTNRPAAERLIHRLTQHPGQSGRLVSREVGDWAPVTEETA